MTVANEHVIKVYVTGKTDTKKSDFETAIAATGYGKFNYLLFLWIIPVSWASSIDTANMSMILTPAECDLKLTMLRKGILNAVTFGGMLSSSVMWGILADLFGRRKIMVYGFIADGICNIFSGFAPNIWILVAIKFTSGFIVSGAVASMISYCAEFHATKSRAKILLQLAFAASFGNIVNGALALSIIPRDWSFVIEDKDSEVLFNYNSWRIFLSVCGLPSLVGAICLSYFPENPKFLMSQGRNSEAMDVFRTIYSMNTGKPKESYPILELENEKEPTQELTSKKSPGIIDVLDSLKQIRPLISKHYLTRLLLVIFIQFGILLSASSVRLWQPHFFAIIEKHESSALNSTFCEILDASMTSNFNDSTPVIDEPFCSESSSKTPFVYTNNLIIASSPIIALFFGGILLAHVDYKKLMLFTSAFPSCFLMSMNWSTSTVMTLVFICLFVALMATTAYLNVGITVNLFPTSLRTTAVSLVLMVGRIGAVTGSMLFPVLLERGCLSSLSALSGLIMVCLVFIIFIPKPDENVK